MQKRKPPRAMRIGKSNAQSGFTLVEVAVSVLVLGLGFVSLLTVFTAGLKWSSEVITDSTAQFAAHTGFEMNSVAAADPQTVGRYEVGNFVTGDPAQATTAGGKVFKFPNP